jgi:hypothetical protein
MRDPLEVLQELTGNIKCSGKQYYAFQEYRNEQGERVFYDTNGTLRLQGAQESALELGGPNTGVTYFRPWYSVYFISFHIFSYLFTNGRNILQLYLQYSAEVVRLIQTIST